MSSELLGVKRSTAVQVPVEQAFQFFISSFEEWWPAEFTWSQDVLEGITIESGVGGLCSELGPHGFRCDWGRLLVWEPPAHLVIAWQIAPSRAPEPNPAKASEVDVRFEAAGAGATRVTVQHRGFESHGGDWQAYRDGMAVGWKHVLDAYSRALSPTNSPQR